MLYELYKQYYQDAEALADAIIEMHTRVLNEESLDVFHATAKVIFAAKRVAESKPIREAHEAQRDGEE